MNAGTKNIRTTKARLLVDNRLAKYEMKAFKIKAGRLLNQNKHFAYAEVIFCWQCRGRFGESFTSRGDDGKELLARRQFARGASTILFFSSQGQTSNPKNDKSVKERRVYIFKYWGESN